MLDLLKRNHDDEEDNKDVYTALSSICVFEPLAPYAVVSDIIDYFMYCLETNKTQKLEAKTSILKALSKRCPQNEELYKNIKDSDKTIPFILDYIKEMSKKFDEKDCLSLPLNILRHFCKGNKSFIGKLINNNFLDQVVEILSLVKKTNSRKILFSVLKSISNDD